MHLCFSNLLYILQVVFVHFLSMHVCFSILFYIIHFVFVHCVILHVSMHFLFAQVCFSILCICVFQFFELHSTFYTCFFVCALWCKCFSIVHASMFFNSLSYNLHCVCASVFFNSSNYILHFADLCVYAYVYKLFVYARVFFNATCICIVYVHFVFVKALSYILHSTLCVCALCMHFLFLHFLSM